MSKPQLNKVAFIGLGHMGCPMAVNLAKAGLDVVGFDLSEAARAAAAGLGLTTVATLAEAATGADAVVTMLTTGTIVRSVHEAVIALTSAQALIIDSSTIDIASARAVHDLAKRHGLRSVDAPVSGGVSAARAATLTFMCGGDDASFAAARPLLEAMGKRVIPCGPAGSGQAAKICNNMILGVSMIAVCEAFTLADRMGLSRQAMFDVVSTSSGSCWSLNAYCPAPGVGPASPADEDYRPGFAAALMLKDLKLSQDAAESVGAATPLGAHAARIYDKFVAKGDGGRDFSAIIEALAVMNREDMP